MVVISTCVDDVRGEEDREELTPAVDTEFSIHPFQMRVYGAWRDDAEPVCDHYLAITSTKQAFHDLPLSR